MASSVVKTKISTVSIGENPTEIAVTEFENKIFIIITQIGKFGTLVSVRTDTVLDLEPLDVTDTIYHTQVLLGKDDVEIHAAARFICGNLTLSKPVVLSMALKNLERDSLVAASTAILTLMKSS